jgi:hypothetical protein
MFPVLISSVEVVGLVPHLGFLTVGEKYLAGDQHEQSQHAYPVRGAQSADRPAFYLFESR